MLTACSGGSSGVAPSVTPLTDTVSTMSRLSRSINSVENKLNQLESQAIINEGKNYAFYGAEVDFYNDVYHEVASGIGITTAIQSVCSEKYVPNTAQNRKYRSSQKYQGYGKACGVLRYYYVY